MGPYPQVYYYYILLQIGGFDHLWYTTTHVGVRAYTELSVL